MPDVHPAELVQRPGLLSMCAGDFVEVYSAPDQAGAFDCVATCFFLDTAHNILQYMQIISHILKVMHDQACKAPCKCNTCRAAHCKGSACYRYCRKVQTVPTCR